MLIFYINLLFWLYSKAIFAVINCPALRKKFVTKFVGLAPVFRLLCVPAGLGYGDYFLRCVKLFGLDGKELKPECIK